jgi:hypothetical protein
VISLFPNIFGLTKWKRRAAMVAAFPLVWLEANVNFLISAYQLWNKERIIGDQ